MSLARYFTEAFPLPSTHLILRRLDFCRFIVFPGPAREASRKTFGEGRSNTRLAAARTLLFDNLAANRTNTRFSDYFELSHPWILASPDHQHVSLRKTVQNRFHRLTFVLQQFNVTPAERAFLQDLASLLTS